MPEIDHGTRVRASSQHNDNGFIENSFRGVADRALALVGNRLKAINALAKKGDKWLTKNVADLGRLHWDGKSIIPSWISSAQARKIMAKTSKEDFFDALAQDLIDIDTGYRPQYTWDKVKQGFQQQGVSTSAFGTVLAYAAEQGVQSIPDMVSSVLNFPAYIVARTGEIGSARAVNNNKTVAEIEDYLHALPFAVGAAALERVGSKGITEAGVERLGVEILKRSIDQSARKIISAGAKAGAKEAATEAVQSGVLEYLGERVNTQANMSIIDAADQALAGAVAGGVYGAAAGTVSASVNELQGKHAGGVFRVGVEPDGVVLPKLHYFNNRSQLIVIRDYLKHFVVEGKTLTATELAQIRDWAVNAVASQTIATPSDIAILNEASRQLESHYLRSINTGKSINEVAGRWFDPVALQAAVEQPQVSVAASESGFILPDLHFVQASDRGWVILDLMINIAHVGSQVIDPLGGHSMTKAELLNLRGWMQKHMVEASHAWSKDTVDRLKAISTDLEITVFNINTNRYLPVPHDGHVHNGGWFRGSYEPRVKHPVYGDENPLQWLYAQLDTMGQLSHQIFFSVAPYRSFADHRAGHEHDHLGYYALRQAGLRTPFDGEFRRNDKTGLWEADEVTIQRAVRDEYGAPRFTTDAYGARQVVRRPEVIDGRFEISHDELLEQLGRDELPAGTEVIHFGYTQTHHCNLCYADPKRDYAIAKDIIELPEKYRDFALLGMVAGNPFTKDGWKTRLEQLRGIVELEARYANNGRGHIGVLKIPGAGEITLAKEMVLGLTSSSEVRPIGILNDQGAENVQNYFKTLFDMGGVAIVHADIGNVQPIAQRFPQLPSVNDNLNAIKDLFRSAPNGRFVWAHGGGLGRFIAPGISHIRMLRNFMEDPSLSHVNIDLSWDVINKYMVKDTETMVQWARLVHDFPNRFIYGSDSVGISQHTGILPHFSGYDMLEQAGFFNKLIELDNQSGDNRDSLARFFRTNFEETFLPAAQRMSDWRANKEAQKWLDERGYDNGIPMPVVYPRMTANNGVVLTGQSRLHYNLDYFVQRYGDAHQQQLAIAQAQQALPVHR